MEVVEAKLEIFRISKAVGLPFEGFDFVYETLHGASGDTMLEIVQKSSAAGPERSNSLSFPLRASRFPISSKTISESRRR
jgi:hypothetical protein